MYAAAAIGALLKGPVAIALPGMAVVAFLIVQRDWRGILRAIRVDGLLIALAIAAPWFIVVSLRNPEFPSYFFLHEHLRRFSGTDERIRPWWYYLPIVFAGLAPWSVPGVFGVADWLRRRRRMPSAAACFCAVWVAVVLLLFSAAASKLGTYVLPLFPPAAILLARIVRRQVAGEDRLVFATTGWALIVLGIGCAIANPVFLTVWDDDRAALLASRLLLGGVALVITGRLVLRAIQDERLGRAVVALACGTGVLLAVAMSGRAVSTGYRALSKEVAATLGPDDVLVSYSRYVRGLSFYTGRRAVVAGGWAELSFGREHSPEGAEDYFWNSNEPLIAAWNSDRRVILVIERVDLPRLLPRFERPPIQIAAQHGRVAVANR